MCSKRRSSSFYARKCLVSAGAKLLFHAAEAYIDALILGRKDATRRVPKETNMSVKKIETLRS